MSPRSRASAVTSALRERLDDIKPLNGYMTELRAVYGPADRVPDKAPMPYALVRPASDSRTGLAVTQATRLRTFEVEIIFPASADEGALCDVHVDVLRALGIGHDQPERQFPGLLEEQDDATFDWATQGVTTHRITISLGVTYVESYN